MSVITDNLPTPFEQENPELGELMANYCSFNTEKRYELAVLAFKNLQIEINRGRNNACSCGSRKKIKKCCGSESEINEFLNLINSLKYAFYKENKSKKKNNHKTITLPLLFAAFGVSLMP